MSEAGRFIVDIEAFHRKCKIAESVRDVNEQVEIWKRALFGESELVAEQLENKKWIVYPKGKK